MVVFRSTYFLSRWSWHRTSDVVGALDLISRTKLGLFRAKVTLTVYSGRVGNVFSPEEHERRPGWAWIPTFIKTLTLRPWLA